MKKSRKGCSVNAARWISYAAAGAATAVAASNDAEAAILYSGPINTTIGINHNASNFVSYFYAHTLVGKSHFGSKNLGYLTAQSNTIGNPRGFKQLDAFDHLVLQVANPGVRGVLHHTTLKTNSHGGHISFSRAYASKLAFGANIAGGHFNLRTVNSIQTFDGKLSGGTFTSHPGQRGIWGANGNGFLGFEFNSGGGEQYGWMHLALSGPNGVGHLELIDYAYGTPGQAITAGQTAVPEPASLSLLAFGAAGLLAMRAARRRRVVEEVVA